MTFQIVIILILIGVCAGMMSGFVGIGGGVIIVPSLIYLLGMGQHEAQGTSLLLMLPPIGILAFMNYYNSKSITNTNIIYGSIIAVTFIIGGYFGSKLSLKMDGSIIKIIFGIIMALVAIKMIFSGYKEFK